MKKTICLLLAVIMTLSLFAACSKEPEQPSDVNTGEETNAPDDNNANSGEDTNTPDDTAVEIITPPDKPVVINIDSSLMGDRKKTVVTTITERISVPASSDTNTSSGSQGQSSGSSQTVTPGTSGQASGSASGSTRPPVNNSNVKMVSAAAEQNLHIGFFGDSITGTNTATDFHAMSLEGGVYIYSIDSSSTYYTAYLPSTYNLYEIFKWTGTKADSKITSLSNAKISKVLDVTAPALDYFVAAVSRDRSIATKDGEGRSITAYKYLNELLHKQNPNARLVLLVPPGYQDGCTFYSEKLSMTNKSRAEHNLLIKAFTAKLTAEIPDAIVVQAGDAFEYFISNYGSTGINLYRTDLRTQSAAGAYLMAAVLYETLYGKSVYGMEFSSELTQKEAEILQKAAHEFVFGTTPTAANSHHAVAPVQILFEDDARFKNEVYPENFDALFAAAMAYYDRHRFFQYDSLCMDRISYVYYRRSTDRTGHPEEGTPQNTVYLDCSSFVWCILNAAYGYNLPENKSRTLTYDDNGTLKNMSPFVVDMSAGVSPETAIDDLIKTLQPGDLIAYNEPTNKLEKGHVVLYLGKGYFMHCSSHSRLDGGGATYLYTTGAKHDTRETWGGISIGKIDFITNPVMNGYQFDPNDKMTIRVIRPDYSKLTPTEDALNRVKNMQHVVAYKLSSAPKGYSVNPGGTVDFTVVIKNVGTDTKTVSVTDTLPNGLTLKSGNNNFSVTVAPGETKTQTYTLEVASSVSPGTTIEYNTTKAGGVTLNNSPVYVNKTLSESDQHKLSDAARAAASKAADSYELVKAAYDAIGVTLPFSSVSDAFSKVYKTDTSRAASTGAVTFVKDQNTISFLPYGLWGGTLVTIKSHTGRIKTLTHENLVPGDIISVAEGNASKSEAALYIYLDDQTIMTVKNGKPVTYKAASGTNELLERFIGEVAFYVCRPSQG